MMKLPERSEGNFFMFLKTNEGLFILNCPKKHAINGQLHFATFIVSYLASGLSINFPKLVIHNIDIVTGTKYLIKLKW